MSLKTQIIVVSCLFVAFALLSMISRMRLRRPPRRYKRKRRSLDSPQTSTGDASNPDDSAEDPAEIDVAARGKGVIIAAVVAAVAALALVLMYD